MAEISKVIEEEFDEEGNLVRRTTTEYGPRYAMGGVVKYGIRLPGDPTRYAGGVYPSDGSYAVNLREGE